MLELDFTQILGSHCLQIRETLPASGITAIFGVSGAGKTSFMEAINLCLYGAKPDLVYTFN